MFGDPVKNTKGLPSMDMKDVTNDILSGQCLNGEPREMKSGEKAVLKVSAVTYGYFKEDEYKVITDLTQIKKGVYPKKGDLLFSRANTREYVAATCLVDKDYPDLMLPDKLWKLSFKEIVNPIYMKAFMSMPQIRNILSEQATGTSGSMFNISMPKLKKLCVLVPSVEKQNRYAELYIQTDKSKFLFQIAIYRDVRRKRISRIFT